MKLVLHPPVEEERFQAIKDAAGAMSVVNASTTEDALTEIVDATAFFGKMTPELLAAAQKIDWVQSPTASLEHYVFPQLVEHPCRLSNMRGLYYDVIADHVMGYVLCFARNLHTYMRRQLEARWAPVGHEDMTEQPFLMGPSSVTPMDRSHIHMADTTIGVVGAGSIGQEICRRAAAFGGDVVAVDPVCRSVEGVVDEVWDVDRLFDLLTVSDFVVIAAPHTPETEKLFRTAEFERMKRSAIVINIGRGAIVDLTDLTLALQQGTIAGAALDVYEIEPLPTDHPLWAMPNVIMTPHVAAASPHIAVRHRETLLDNVARYARGEEPRNLVDKHLWY